MEIIIFIAGFIFGGIAVFIPQFLMRKNEDKNREMMLEQMKLYFENTANKVIQDGSTSLNEQNKEKLEEFFKRFRERIEDFEKRADANFKTETENFTKFDMNIRNFIETGSKISNETTNLIKVMRADNKTSGHWGEIVLEKVLEASGLRRDEEFRIQKGTGEGRPDAIVELPEGRCIFIDSKTSFDSWYGYVNAENDDEKSEYLKKFTDSTKKHITGLAGRDYTENDKSPDYVLMFIPIEGCYSMMFCDECSLWDYAWKNNVMPVSPSTLLAALKTINVFHQLARQNKNVSEMARICAGVYDKFAALYDELLKIQNNLNNSLKKLEGHGNILNQIKKIEKLGAQVKKQLPEIDDESENKMLDI